MKEKEPVEFIPFKHRGGIKRPYISTTVFWSNKFAAQWRASAKKTPSLETITNVKNRCFSRTNVSFAFIEYSALINEDIDETQSQLSLRRNVIQLTFSSIDYNVTQDYITNVCSLIQTSKTLHVTPKIHVISAIPPLVKQFLLQANSLNLGCSNKTCKDFLDAVCYDKPFAAEEITVGLSLLKYPTKQKFPNLKVLEIYALSLVHTTDSISRINKYFPHESLRDQLTIVKVGQILLTGSWYVKSMRHLIYWYGGMKNLKEIHLMCSKLG